jgi:hypothetical protein
MIAMRDRWQISEIAVATTIAIVCAGAVSIRVAWRQSARADLSAPSPRTDTIVAASVGTSAAPQAGGGGDNRRTYRGAWFEIWSPPGFTVTPSLKSATSSQGYDSAFFRSTDGSVEFYVFSPQWNGDPSDIAVTTEETVVASDTKESASTVVTWYTVQAKDGTYTRTYQDSKAKDGTTRWVIGVKYTSQRAFDGNRNTYRRFKESLTQFAD